MSLHQIFATPMWEFVYPDFNAAQEKFVFAAREVMEKYPKSFRKSNFGGGYQSPNLFGEVDLFAPILRFAEQVTIKAAADIGLDPTGLAVNNVWVNINDSRSAINVQHTHDGVFSGVFYIKTPAGSGAFDVKNEAVNTLWEGLNRVNSSNLFTMTNLQLTPSEGRLLLFPAYLPHSVMPNYHTDERISLAFNIA